MAKTTLVQRLMFIPPLLAGAAVVWFAVATKAPPERVETTEPVRKVRVVQAVRGPMTPRVVAYGNVRAANVWNAVAEVSGRIIHVHAKLANGSVITPGTTLVRIDPRSYELALAQLEAERAEIDIQETNTGSALDIERRNVTLAEQELTRQKELGARGTAARTAVDQAERTVLATRQAVRSLQSTLALLPAQRKVLAARIEQAQLDLARTAVNAPFALRIADLQIENNQYVGIGSALFKGESIDEAEVHVEIPPQQMRRLVGTRDGAGPVPLEQLASSMREVLKIDARVQFPGFDDAEGWDARFERLKLVNTSTQTIGLVVSVADPYRNAIPGKRPPLVSGMFVRVELRGQTLRDRVFVPRTAVHGNVVHIADDTGRLARRTVTIEFFQDDVAIVAAGLAGGEAVVLTDLAPAVPGTRLDQQLDDVAEARLRAARAQGPSAGN